MFKDSVQSNNNNFNEFVVEGDNIFKRTPKMPHNNILMET